MNLGVGIVLGIIGGILIGMYLGLYLLCAYLEHTSRPKRRKGLW